MKTKIKWYNDEQMVGTLLIFWPPLGLYGIYRSETIKPEWKKLTFGTFGLVCILLIMVLMGS